MSKFDVVEKIGCFDLMTAFLKKSKTSPYRLLKKDLFIAGDWQENYFDWGRNALFYLFKNLKYKKIAFPAFTCPTLIQAAEAAGKEIVLLEIDLNTFNLDIEKIPSETKCLVVVHTFGNPVNIKAIKNKFPQAFILEDCAHSLFSKIDGKFVGDQGNAVLFSFYKQIANINGSLLLAKDKLIKKQKRESSFKYLKRLIFKTNGVHQWILNFKRHQYLPEIEPHSLTKNKSSNLSFVLFEKGFKKLKNEVEKRKQVAKWYYQQTENSPYLISQRAEENSRPSYYHFAVRLKPSLVPIRDRVVLSLRKRNIFLARLWYDAPIAKKQFKSYQKSCPNALLLAQSVINLPIYSSYTSTDVVYLFSQLNQTIKAIKNA